MPTEIKIKHLNNGSSFSSASASKFQYPSPLKSIKTISSSSFSSQSFSSNKNEFGSVEQLKIELEDKELWDQFFKYGSEMVISKSGRY